LDARNPASGFRRLVVFAPDAEVVVRSLVAVDMEMSFQRSVGTLSTLGVEPDRLKGLAIDGEADIGCRIAVGFQWNSQVPGCGLFLCLR
jgi:hypothetical protein